MPSFFVSINKTGRVKFIGLNCTKEHLDTVNKCSNNELHVKNEIVNKCKYEDDPLMQAMKKELSSRIFGSPSNSIKKEEFEDPNNYRNSLSPLIADEKFLNFGNNLKENETDYQWFSIIPKESCDPRSQMLSKE